MAAATCVGSARLVGVPWRTVRRARFGAVTAGCLLSWQSRDGLNAQRWIISERQARSGREFLASLLNFERLLPYCIVCMGVVTRIGAQTMVGAGLLGGLALRWLRGEGARSVRRREGRM